MGVYIKGMEMIATPTDGAALVIDAYVRVDTDGKATLCMDDDTFAWREYQLVPVPPHGRLIDADAFLKTIRPITDEDSKAACTFETVKRLMFDRIGAAPTIIPAEPAEEGE